jgi:adenosylhomocysteine nucleosidase
MFRVAIVAALEREVRPLVRRWKASEREHSARCFRFFEDKEAVLVCAGIGAEAARRAAEAVIALYAPRLVYSVGFAGALNSSFKIGDIIRPSRVVNASDGSSTTLTGKDGVLVSFSAVASREQKSKLRESFGADAVDMEAGSVARAAQLRGTEFAVLKVISDEAEFEMPPMDRFVGKHGSFSEARFAIFTAVRPWLWPQVLRLARNSALASRALSAKLVEIINELDKRQQPHSSASI